MEVFKNRVNRIILNMKLGTRMMFIYSILTLIVIAFMSSYFYGATINLLKSKQKLTLQDSLDYLTNLINVRVTGIDQNFMNIFGEQKFRSLYFDSQKYRNDRVKQLEIGSQLTEYFTEVIGKDNDILASVILADNNKNVFSDTNSPQYSYSDFANTIFARRTTESRNKIQFVNNSLEDKYFAMARSFYFIGNSSPEAMQVGMGTEDGNNYSTLVFFLNKSYLQDLVKKAISRNEATVLILDEEDNLVLKSGQLPDNIINKYHDYVKGHHMADKGSYEFNAGASNLIIDYEKMVYSNWHIVMVYNEKELYRDTASILSIVLFIAVVALILTIVISYYVSRSVVKPIKKLINIMGSTVESDMEVSYKTKYNDEIAYLGTAYNKLIVQIQEMIGTIKKEESLKRKQELKALQAQINPHFLYNTLDMVYLLAKTDKNDKVANIVADLGDFFRLSLNKGEDITTVNNEVEHVKRYLSIQKTRWSKKFDYEVSVQEDLRDRPVPKLILQPIVENSLAHGLYDIDYKGMIKIKVYSDNDRIIFSVEDNGVGIEEEIAQKIVSGSKIEKSKSGYALRNVYERIKLYTGEEHCISIKQKEEGGTIILISIKIDSEIKEA